MSKPQKFMSKFRHNHLAFDCIEEASDATFNEGIVSFLLSLNYIGGKIP